MSESDVYRRQILTYKDGLRNERVYMSNYTKNRSISHHFVRLRDRHFFQNNCVEFCEKSL